VPAAKELELTPNCTVALVVAAGVLKVIQDWSAARVKGSGPGVVSSMTTLWEAGEAAPACAVKDSEAGVALMV
jgi:hypothetical protein